LSKFTLDDQTKKFQVVSGALPISPNGLSGISLITDPSYLFNYLEQVAPNVKNIHVAYSKKSAWLIELAKSAALEKGLTLNLQKVSDTAQAIKFYQQIFSSGVSNKDAIWLPFDRISSHDKITLPLILEKAWAKEVVVFSSKPSHAKRGVLFSTYPDNFALGKHLFTMVHELEQQPEQKNFAALKSTLLAVNLRTAAHLGLKYSSEQQQSFKLTFPE
jgi:putative ABC transport system substrate-binding protein